MKRSNYLTRKTRIIATVGPASSSKTKITELIRAGVSVFRLNMSHGEHEQHREAFTNIRKIASEMGRHIPIFCDLCGPKIRAGQFEEGKIKLSVGKTVTLTTRKVIGKEGLIPCQYAQLHEDVDVNDRILLDDGKLELKVISVIDKDICCDVIYGGVLSDHKGINLPDTAISTSALTLADRKDVLFAVEMGADFLALSFVRSAEDIVQLKNYISKQESSIPIISKIEKPEALTNIDEILQQSYAIMVARGDLGIEIEPAQVPIVQKELIDKARCAHKPVIVATQMMESMIESARPTRAEVGDINTAALNGADAVMLSGETSVGKFPVQAVRYMNDILVTAEKWQLENKQLGRMPEQYYLNHSTSKRTAISSAAVEICHDLSLLAILLPTRSGYTASVLAAFRPNTQSIGVASTSMVCRQLALHWGLIPVLVEEQTARDWKTMSLAVLQKLGINVSDKSVCVLSGFSGDDAHNEPVLKLFSFE